MNDLNDFWLAVDFKDNTEWLFFDKPIRNEGIWLSSVEEENFVRLDDGAIEQILGRQLTWADEPVEVKLTLK